jgi:N-acetylmuramoyl-L-alanine amidase
MVAGVSVLLFLAVGKPAPAASPGPAIVTVQGQYLMVSTRNSDGTLGPPAPYLIRGINWSPASRNTATSPSDPNNAAVRRPEFGLWYATDIPLMASMHVNTVRLSIDPGTDATALTVLDTLYQYGIMAVVTVDNAVNDTNHIVQVVNALKNHPAILGWMIGNEWNINLYYGVASSVLDAAQRTQAAASLIKTLDGNHPVVASYGDIDINATGLRLSDTSTYVNQVCTTVDLWALNIYRGQTFGTLFSQWQSISSKPLVIGEFGTDAFHSTSTSGCPGGSVDEAMQANWDVSLWNDLLRNSYKQNACGTAAGGFAFEFQDEWWKVPPAGSQQTCGFASGGHPDGFANEEYFGKTDIDRHPRQAYSQLASTFLDSYTPQAANFTLEAISRGANAEQWGGQYGFAQFYEAGTLLYSGGGGGGGGRGFNATVIDSFSGSVLKGPQNFDTYITRDSGTAANALLQFLVTAPAGAIVMLAVADDAGLNGDNSCGIYGYPWEQGLIQVLQTNGSQLIQNICFRDSWSLIYIVGGRVLAEQLSHTSAAADSQATVSGSSAPSCIPPTAPKIHLEWPAQGSIVSGMLSVSGWAVDGSSAGTAIARVQVKVDGNVVGNATYGTARPDVCSVYSSRPGCPNVGFSFSLNTASITPGFHIISVVAADSDGIPDSASDTVTITRLLGPPTVHIESPVAQSSISGSILIYGWAVDNAEGIGDPIQTLQVLIDGNVIGTATYGVNRPDVCNAYPNRPGCPNVGFSYSLSTSWISPGTHTITVQASGGTSPGSDTVTVTIPAVPPTVHIETPAPGAAISGTYMIGGWAIDNRTAVGNSIGTVKVLVDGTLVGTATYGINRPDVCSVYPSRPDCPYVGFSYVLSTSGLLPGTHTITVTATDTDTTPDSGSDSVTINVAAPSGPPSIHLEFPVQNSTVSGVIGVSGWAVDNASAVGTAISSAQVKVDGVVVGSATYGLARPDVCSVYPGRLGCPNVGFAYALNTATLVPGAHTIAVVATDSDTAPDSGSDSVTINVAAPSGPPSIHLEFPVQNSTVSGVIGVSGWAVDNASAVGTAISSTQVKVDGVVVGSATYGLARPDVCNVYPGRSGCPNVGFAYALNTATLAPGAHTITVTATDSDGTPDVGNDSVMVQVFGAPTVYIESPAQGTVVSGLNPSAEARKSGTGYHSLTFDWQRKARSTY